MASVAAGKVATAKSRYWRDEAPLWLAATGAVGAHSFLFPGVSVADLALAAAAAWAACKLWLARHAPQPARWLLWVAFLAAWSLLGAAVLAASSPFGFSWMEFGKSFAKLLFYPAAAFLVGTTLDRLTAARVASVLLWALTIGAILASYIYVTMAAELDLPYKFLWILSEHGEETAHFGFGAVDLPVRARGVASEPSALGYFLVVGLAAVLLLASRAGWRPFRWRTTFVLVSVLLTFSLTSYALLGVLCCVLLLHDPKRSFTLLQRVVIPATLAVALALALPISQRAFDTMVLERAVEIATGLRDVSATLRLRSSWEMAAAMVRSSPVYGAGLGHYDVALETLRPTLALKENLDPGTQGWNALAYLLGALGLPGLLGGLLLLWELGRHSPAAATMMTAATFADSTILGAPFWLFYLLLYRSGAPSGGNDAPLTTRAPVCS